MHILISVDVLSCFCALRRILCGHVCRPRLLALLQRQNPTSPSTSASPIRDGTHVRKRDIANLTHCDPQEIAAIELALQSQRQPRRARLARPDPVAPRPFRRRRVDRLRSGPPPRPPRKPSGSEFAGQLALWQVIARVLEQGSRLSAVRLAQVHAACDVLGIQRGFDENDLYDNLTWLSAAPGGHREAAVCPAARTAKTGVVSLRRDQQLPGRRRQRLGGLRLQPRRQEGQKTDRHRLVCDEQGEPVSTEVFRGNTQDPQTFAAQVNKASQRFGCERVTFVGDRGMIKSGQVEDLVAGRISLHHRHHQAADRYADRRRA